MYTQRNLKFLLKNVHTHTVSYNSHVSGSYQSNSVRRTVRVFKFSNKYYIISRHTMTNKQSYFRPKHKEARKTVHVVQNKRYSLFLQSSSHNLISRTFVTNLHHNKSSTMANIITLERLLQAIASPPAIIQSTTIPQDKDIIWKMPSLRNNITAILNEVESTATCPNAQVFN
jgi:hypothetical protein